MFKDRNTEKMSFGIVGLGRFGYALAEELAKSGTELIVIDSDEEKVRELREVTENCFIIKNLDKKSLMETGIQNCDIAVVCIGEKLDISILTTLNLVSLGIPKVIAKATSIEHGEILKKLGAEVVYPEHDMAVRLANRMESSRVLDFIHLSERVNISKLELPESLVGTTVQGLNPRANFSLNIIAIENGSSVIDDIKPDYAFRKGDILFVVGSRDGMMRFSELTGKDRK